MADTPETRRSSVALIERTGPNPVFFLEHRRACGEYPYAGKYGFFGGGAECDEGPWGTVIREVYEETGLYLPKNKSLDWEQIATMPVCGEARDGAQVLRSVTLFHLILPSGSRVRAKETGRSEIFQLPVAVDAIMSMEDELTPFTYTHLLARMKGEGPWKGARY